MRRAILSFVAVVGLVAPVPGLAEELETSAGPVDVRRAVAGLDTPWAIAFLPDGGQLITERGGRLLLIRDGKAVPVTGVPDVRAKGQGGLLDVQVARDFERSREIFLTFSEPMGRGAGTALAVARLDAPAKLSDLRVIFRQAGGSDAGKHFGSRVVEAPDGTLYLTIGDRGERERAQDLGSHNGKVIRVARNGAIPPDNPFVGQAGAEPAIWSYGHRNPQGAALGPDGAVWTVEHGPKGGDEINRPGAGKNHGWPVISYGVEYSGGKVGRGTAAEGMEQPVHYWDPSIAPSGMMIYSGRLWPEWKDDIFVGSLKFDMISRLSGDAGGLVEAERLFQGEFPRIRDVREAPDGSIWFLSEDEGAAYRMTPAEPES